MNDSSTKYILIVCILIAGVLVYFLFFHSSNKSANITKNITTQKVSLDDIEIDNINETDINKIELIDSIEICTSSLGEITRIVDAVSKKQIDLKSRRDRLPPKYEDTRKLLEQYIDQYKNLTTESLKVNLHLKKMIVTHGKQLELMSSADKSYLDSIHHLDDQYVFYQIAQQFFTIMLEKNLLVESESPPIQHSIRSIHNDLKESIKRCETFMENLEIHEENIQIPSEEIQDAVIQKEFEFILNKYVKR